MASRIGMPSLSLRHGFRCVTEATVTVEEFLVAVGEKVGYDNVAYASRMNKAVVVFLKEERLVDRMVEQGVLLKGMFIQVTPLFSPSTRVTISNVPPFIPNELLERELLRFGKFASSIKVVPLGCKHPALKQVMSFRRQVFMFLDSPEQTLEISFKVKYDNRLYMAYASTGSQRCFECGDVGHKRHACPKREKAEGGAQVVIITPGPTDVGRGGLTVVEQPQAPVAEEQVIRVEATSLQLVLEGNIMQQKNIVVEGKDGSEEPVPQTGEEVPSMSAGVQEGVHVELVSQVVEEMPGTSDGVQVGSVERDVVEGSQWSVASAEEDQEKDMDISSDMTAAGEDSIYDLEEVNGFLDQTFGKSVKLAEYFDVDKFVRSAVMLQKTVGLDQLSEKKRFRLRKFVTAVTAAKGGGKRGQVNKKRFK
nr:uncharacterized protein LOC112077994 [Salvelinus alpinus]